MTRLLTAIVPIIWGTTYIVTTDVLPPGRPLLAGLMRALPAGLLLLLIFRRLPLVLAMLFDPLSAALGAANIGGFFAFLFLAAYLLPGGVASIVTNTAPLWVIALSPIMLGTSMKLRQIIGAGIAVLGVGALVLTPSSHLNMAGVAAGLAASVCMATGIVLAKKWGKPEGTPLLAVTGWQLTLGGLLLLPPMLLIEGVPESLTAANWAGYAYLTIFGALIAYGLWFNGIAKLDVVQVAILSVLSPVTATLLGVVVKGEELSAVQWAGVAAVLVALVAVQTEGMGKRAAARRG